MVGNRVVAIALMVAVGATGASAATAVASLSASSNATLAATVGAARMKQAGLARATRIGAITAKSGMGERDVERMLDAAATSRSVFSWSMIAFVFSVLLLLASSLRAVSVLMTPSRQMESAN
ncbi:hypothetical protein [Caballeronia sp. LZ032]|uniref:hypothetical protein n=1 Tax=Caballeronia sp. LZ032 TaxID=3038565 RepID=UPI0028617D17|nr:hypothetical protein [Caballeronia sp. LZ032]MDR5883792.1 hypothetical protein [Caballeronia sp. LZ032]